MSKSPIVFTRHAQTMKAERGIKEEWIERTITDPEAAELDPSQPDVRRAFRSIPENGDRILRVVYAPIGDMVRIVTAFFDRSRRR
jgi:hypothetical protein